MSSDSKNRRHSGRLRKVEVSDTVSIANTENPNKRRKSIRSAASRQHQLDSGVSQSVVEIDGVKYIEDQEALQRYRQEGGDVDGLDLLGKLSAAHHLLSSELAHLQRFTSLVTWEPDFSNSKLHNDYLEDKYDLWNDDEPVTGGSSRKSRRSKRVVVNPLISDVEKSEAKFVEEVFHPSQYYRDHFLKEENVKKSIQSSEPASILPKRRKDTAIAEKQKVRKGSVQSKQARAKSKAGHKGSRSKELSGDELEQVIEGTEDSDDDDEEEDEDNEDSLDEDSLPLFIENGPVPKLHLLLNPPQATITAPEHVAKSEFGSLEGYLSSFRSLDEDITPEQYESHIQAQREFVENFKRAVQNNVLAVDSEFNVTKVPLPRPFKDPLRNQHTHHDHLVGQAVYLSKLIGDSKRARIQRARKVSQMVESHFKRLVGAEERARKEEERRLKALARNAIQAVKKRWTMAEKAYRILKKQEIEELKRIKGKEHLSQMLEHSTQLLEAQMSKQSDDEDVSEISHQSDSGDLSDFVDDKLQDVDDSKLTVEQLKAKYGHLQGLDFEEVSEATERETTVPEETDRDEPVPEDTDKDETPVELTEQEKTVLENENAAEHDSLLDSDTSLSSDEDSDSEMEDSEEEEPGEEDASEHGGLASLFGNVAADDEDNEYSARSENESTDEAESESIKTTPEDQAKDILTPSSTPDAEKSITKTSRASTETADGGVVDVPVPDLLLRGNLRSYQKQGLNWLASLYNNHTNGILADEMGLGKTIQTISLICYLAVFKGIWGPHLIVVPTSVLLNWEMEFKRFAPGFKLMVYYGSPQQRKEKRKGWNKPDTFHVCITSYQLVCQDQQIFKRKKWRYMILDEAHNIKNFKSNRWNALLNFNTENRLLLTGTPLQNNIMELWSLLYFLMPSSKATQSMPSGFANLEDFQQWFGKPVDKIIEGGNSEIDLESKKTVSKLHQVLRPYLLRRLKADVESQMPAKHEHVVVCRLSKRQYKLYHEYLARSDTKDMLRNANYISIINCLMQLRKVCNHPDLFEERPILTSFAVPHSVITSYDTTEYTIMRLLSSKRMDTDVDFDVLNLNFTQFEKDGLYTSHCSTINKLQSSTEFHKQIEVLASETSKEHVPNYSDIKEFYDYTTFSEKKNLKSHLEQTLYLNQLRCGKMPVYGANVLKLLSVVEPFDLQPSYGNEMIKPLKTRILDMKDTVDRFAFVTPAVVTLNMKKLSVSRELENELTSKVTQIENPFHEIQTKLSIQFPDKSLLLYDCGKLQKLSKLLQQLKDGGHRALIFTQMTKVLDILEQFLNIMGVRYMRLDGATKIEDRQILTERFNSDPKITVFILSTRSGGLGINLTGADTVIFYDSDWNPAMDKQCQDRCHRIGQTRDVHIYRFVSEYTIESNILKKANQKRHLDNVVIQEGEFTTDYFSKLSVKDLLGDQGNDDLDDSKPLFHDSTRLNSALAQAEDETDAKAAKEAMKEVNLDDVDFDENEAGENNKEQHESFGQDDEGFGHIDEYMIRYIANGYYYD